MIAKTMKDALNLFDPLQSLNEEQEIKDYYVARENSPIDEMTAFLANAHDLPKLLFSGSPGCGKRTELAKLRENLKKQFHIISCSAKDITTDFNVDIGALLFFVLTQITKFAKDAKLPIYTEKLEKFMQYGYGWEMNIEQTTSAKGKDLTIDPVFIEKFVKKGLDFEGALKHIFKKTSKPGNSELLEYINGTVWELEGKTGKDVLLLVSDMDKISLNNAKEIFIEKFLLLTKLQCSAVFTFPLALKYEPNFIRAALNFSAVYYLPNFTAFDQYGEPDDNGQKKLREIITKRLNDRLIYDEALSRIIELSGGITFELINLVRHCCIQSLKEKYEYIDEETVVSAEEKIRRFYKSVYTTDELRYLAQIRETKDFDRNETGIKLLNHLSISEYGAADDIWYDVNPILLPLLSETETEAE
ncbi:MAG: hypothetical protein ACOY90_09850 [Candidatus Zhuqueibacterota bacterium]